MKALVTSAASPVAETQSLRVSTVLSTPFAVPVA